jgi:hypothetical protein
MPMTFPDRVGHVWPRVSRERRGRAPERDRRLRLRRQRPPLRPSDRYLHRPLERRCPGPGRPGRDQPAFHPGRGRPVPLGLLPPVRHPVLDRRPRSPPRCRAAAKLGLGPRGRRVRGRLPVWGSQCVTPSLRPSRRSDGRAGDRCRWRRTRRPVVSQFRLRRGPGGAVPRVRSGCGEPG